MIHMDNFKKLNHFTTHISQNNAKAHTYKNLGGQSQEQPFTFKLIKVIHTNDNDT